MERILAVYVLARRVNMRNNVRALFDYVTVRDCNRWLFGGVAVLIATAYFFSIFDLAFVLEGNFWRLGHSDIGQHYVGFLYFVRDGWRFPLFETLYLGYPQGTNIIFTDSLPLAALFVKLLRAVLPDWFHPFGLWIFLCYVLLAHSVSALLYHLGCRTLLAAASGALFAVMTPFFLVLPAHAALSGQFLVVYALLLYFRIADNPEWNPRHFAFFIGMLVAALLVHVYLFVMVALIFGCALANAMFGASRSWRQLAVGTLAAIVAVVVTILVAGHLSESVPWTAASGFGYFSMNVLAPVTPARPNPQGTLFYMNLEMHPDGTGGQYAGFNYWGAGIFFLLVASVPAWWKKTRSLGTRRLLPLVIGFLLCTLFALSNRAYLGNRLLLSYDLPEPLLQLANHFHSSGRFFWMVSYGVMAVAVSAGLSLRPRWLGAALVGAALGWQGADTRSLRDSLRTVTRTPEKQLLTEERWRPLLAAHKRVALLPPAQCGGSDALYAEIGRIAAESNAVLHSVLAARYGTAAPESCRALYREVLTQGFQQGTLYILDRGSLLSLSERPEVRNSCSVLEEQGVCTLQREELRLPPLPSESGPALWPPKEGPLNPVELAPFLSIGWSKAEGGGVWSLGDHSDLVFRLSSCADGASLRVKILPFVGQEEQVVTAQANQGVVVSRRYRERNIDTLVVPIGSCDASDPRVVVSFSAEKPLSPLEVGESGDTRPLGILLIEAELLRRPG